MQIKTAMRYHSKPIRMPTIKKKKNRKQKMLMRIWSGGTGILMQYWWEYNMVQPLWKTVW